MRCVLFGVTGTVAPGVMGIAVAHEPPGVGSTSRTRTTTAGPKTAGKVGAVADPSLSSAIQTWRGPAGPKSS